MNTSQQKTASANSPLAATVFFIINILLFPITFIGYVLYVGYLFLFGRMPGVSLTAQGPLSARWTQHIFGVREDEAASRLMTAMPGFFAPGWYLVTAPTLLAHRLTGYVPKAFRYPFEGEIAQQVLASARQTFFDAVVDHLLTPVKFFELAQYLPRIVRMATACEDFEPLGQLIRALDKLLLTVEKDCLLEIKAQKEPVSPEECITHWQQTLAQTLYENIVSAFPSRLSQSGAVGWKAFIAGLETSLKCLGSGNLPAS